MADKEKEIAPKEDSPEKDISENTSAEQKESAEQSIDSSADAEETDAVTEESDPDAEIEAETEDSDPDAAEKDDVISENTVFVETNDDDSASFRAIDVSEPRAPIRESEVIERALKIRRIAWIKSHLVYLFAVLGVIVVGFIVFGIYMYFQSTNPMSRFVSSLTKDFSSSFDYEVEVNDGEETVMSYVGAIEVNRSKHAIDAFYKADYNRYFYTGAVYAHGKDTVAGSLYNGNWSIHDCSEKVQDFFAFDNSFRTGGFDSGAFLRFTELTSDYSTKDLTEMMTVIKQRLSTNSAIATITSEKFSDSTLYHYDINVYELLKMIRDDGASMFYRSPDYDAFVERFEASKTTLQATKCTLEFVVDSAGHMTSLKINVNTGENTYGISCTMSNFGSAEVEIPETFLKAAQIDSENKK